MTPEDIETGESNFPCFCCGICCSKYQVQLTLPDVKRMAESLNMDFHEFENTYIDPRWFGEISFLLRRDSAACVFLKSTDSGLFSLCTIHSFKPSSCHEWLPGLYRRECQEGLCKYWGITVDSSGKLHGPPDKIEAFTAFWRSTLPLGRTANLY